MARYIDADKLKARMFNYYGCVNADTSKSNYRGETLMNYEVADMIEDCIDNAPTADVAPKSEVNRLEYTLLGVMRSVDKWLVGAELEQNEVNRAITMREKTLQIVEGLRSEVKSLEKALSNSLPSYCQVRSEEEAIKTGKEYGKREAAREIFAEIEKLMLDGAIGGKYPAKVINPDKYAELKKKYVEEGAQNEI